MERGQKSRKEQVPVVVVDVETLFSTGLQDKTGQPSHGMCRIKNIRKIIKHQLNRKNCSTSTNF